MKPKKESVLKKFTKDQILDIIWDWSEITLESRPTSWDTKTEASSKFKKVSIKRIMKNARPMTSNTEREATIKELSNFFDNKIGE